MLMQLKCQTLKTNKNWYKQYSQLIFININVIFKNITNNFELKDVWLSIDIHKKLWHKARL